MMGKLPSHRGEGTRKRRVRSVYPLARMCCQDSLLPQVGKKLYQKRSSLSYCVVTYGTWITLLQYVYSLVDIVSNVSAYHKAIGNISLFVCFLSWLLACNVSPGSITKESLAQYAHFPYDNILFTNKVCPTLRIPKVARSKYDRYSKTHVPKFDHYCPVLGQAVGEENYRFFLLFLVLHTTVCYYGSVMLARIWQGLLKIDPRRNVSEEFHHMTVTIRRIALAWILLVIITGAMSLFLGFHMYLMCRGMTTNEWHKWQRLQQETHQREEESRSKAFDEELGGCSTSRKREIPRNIYDKGPYHNVKEVLFPLSIRKRKLERSVL
eukprot:scaffold638_cov168-Amphora_coffeaeformis.AAC.10